MCKLLISRLDRILANDSSIHRSFFGLPIGIFGGKRSISQKDGDGPRKDAPQERINILTTVKGDRHNFPLREKTGGRIASEFAGLYSGFDYRSAVLADQMSMGALRNGLARG